MNSSIMEAEFAHILKSVHQADALGTRVLSNGTRLVGHVPHVAPEARLHLIFPPMNTTQIKAIENGIGKPLPPPLKALFQRTNGLGLFSDSLAIFGYRHSYVRVGDEAWQPFDIITPNLYERPVGADPSEVFFGSYRCDGSLLSISNENLTVVRCDRQSAKPLNRWSSLGVMIVSEVDRLEALFDQQGRQRDPERPTTPPASNSGNWAGHD